MEITTQDDDKKEKPTKHLENGDQNEEEKDLGKYHSGL